MWKLVQSRVEPIRINFKFEAPMHSSSRNKSLTLSINLFDKMLTYFHSMSLKTKCSLLNVATWFLVLPINIGISESLWMD